MRFVNLISCALAATMTLVAADLPYVGKWKMNTAKSDFGSTTVTYESLAGGEWQSTVDGNTYKFKMDGQDHPDGLGDTAAWKAAGSNSWETVWKLNGKVLSSDTLQVSSDGKVLTVHTKGTKPNGDKIDDVATFQRISGSGLAGKWKTKTVKPATEDVVEFVSSGNDGFGYRDASMGLSCDSKLDGKDYPCTGPTTPAGWTVAYTKGPKSLEMTIKKDGKPFYKASYTVSGDGKTMTQSGAAVGSNEKVKVVFDRQ